jgi:acyl-[acyl-carrier-protein]-phospholipid O-acyltransferase/long-chain-fatty-acid--[acyl-carrier-protein] ligase
VNLQDCFAGIMAVAAIEGMHLLGKIIGMSELAGFRMQMVVIGLSCGLMTWFILRILPADFIRLVCLSATKVLYRIKFSGTDQIPKTGGVLLLPNHVTFSDAFFISAACDRPVRFVMDETFMASRLIRFSVALFDAVTIRRDQPLEAIRKTIEALESGHVVALFPEGQLTRTGALCGLERGFELIARKAKSPIFPMWVDGSWGSVFSFERGRFFRKIPHRVPYGLSIVIGEEITEKPNLELVRTAMMRASAEAVGGHFPDGTAPARINGHQLTQLGALPRGGAIHVLAGDDLHGIMSSLEEFAKQTKARILTEESFRPDSGSIWIGGDALRKCIAASETQKEPISFFDFSSDALTPLEMKGVTHLSCIAIDGMVIAMSLPHPSLPKDTSEFQAGHKPNSWGKLLPGWYIEGNQVFPGGLTLPEGATLDRECFLVKG